MSSHFKKQEAGMFNWISHSLDRDKEEVFELEAVKDAEMQEDYDDEEEESKDAVVES